MFKSISYRAKTKMRKLTASIMLLIFLGQPVLSAANTVADKWAGANAPKVTKTKGGTEVVQITAPSSSGVSYNRYLQFNVGSNGLILNNSATGTNTELAGQIKGNSKLAPGQCASIILNEVTGGNISSLRGYIEVAGQKADVIIANPNGIVGNGFGFINTSRVVLTTGTPGYDMDGNLGFNVTQGKILINGDGLDASNVDQVDLISRATEINADIWAKKLNVLAGANQVRYSDLQYNTIASSEDVPDVAIDVKSLGGMYADKISLIGTEKGVGVNSKGTILTKNLTIDSAGHVKLDGSVIAAGNAEDEGNIQITAKDKVTNKGEMYGQGNITIETTGRLKNKGIIKSGKNTSITAQNVKSSGLIGAGITIDGNLNDSGDLSIYSNDKVVLKDVLAVGNIQVDAQGDVKNKDIVYAKGNTVIRTNGILQNDGIINSEKDTALIAKSVNSTGSIAAGTNKDGSFNTSGDLLIASQGDVAVNEILAAGNIQVNAQGDVKNSNTIYSQGNTLISAQGNLENNGTIYSGKDTKLVAHDINSTGTISAGINADGSFGTSGNVGIISAGVTNLSGSTMAAEQIDIASQGDITNSAMLYAKGTATVQTNGALTNTGTIMAGNSVQLFAQGNMTNNSQIRAQGIAEVICNGELQNTGNITAGGDVVLSANGITSSGQIGAGVSEDGTLGRSGNLVIDNGGATYLTGNTLAAGNITIGSEGDVVNTSKIYALGTTGIMSNGGLKNSDTGEILAGQNLNLSINGDINSSGHIVAGINNDGTLGNAGDLTVDTWGTTHLTGATAAAGDINIYNTSSGDITNDGQIYAKKNATINTASELRNTGIIAAGKDVSLGTDYGIRSSGLISAGVSQDADTPVNDGSVTMGSYYNIDNSNAKISATKSVSIISNNGNITNNGGYIQAGQEMIFLAPKGSIVNDGGNMIQYSSSNNQTGIYLRASNISNIGGQIKSASAYSNWYTLVIDASGEICSNLSQIPAGNTVNNTNGIISGNGGVALIGSDIVNTNGNVSAVNNAALCAANNINNDNGTVNANQMVTIYGKTLNSGEIAGRKVYLNGVPSTAFLTADNTEWIPTSMGMDTGVLTINNTGNINGTTEANLYNVNVARDGNGNPIGISAPRIWDGPNNKYLSGISISNGEIIWKAIDVASNVYDVGTIVVGCFTGGTGAELMVGAKAVAKAGAKVVVKKVSKYGKYLKNETGAIRLGSSKFSRAIEDIIAGFKGDVSHIINGSKGTADGHAWEVLFNGNKPSWDEIKPLIADTLENGSVTKIENLPNGGKIVYWSSEVDGHEVWVKEFIQNGVRRLSDAGVNNW